MNFINIKYGSNHRRETCQSSNSLLWLCMYLYLKTYSLYCFFFPAAGTFLASSGWLCKTPGCFVRDDLANFLFTVPYSVDPDVALTALSCRFQFDALKYVTSFEKNKPPSPPSVPTPPRTSIMEVRRRGRCTCTATTCRRTRWDRKSPTVVTLSLDETPGTTVGVRRFFPVALSF